MSEGMGERLEAAIHRAGQLRSYANARAVALGAQHGMDIRDQSADFIADLAADVAFIFAALDGHATTPPRDGEGGDGAAGGVKPTEPKSSEPEGRE